MSREAMFAFGIVLTAASRLAAGLSTLQTKNKTASERTNYPRAVAEMALAHAIGDRVEAAYRRGIYSRSGGA